MPYTHLTPMERGQLQAFVSQGLSQRAIARQLGRSPSTVSRELARNGPVRNMYDAARAQARYLTVRRSCRRTTSLGYLPLQRYLFDKLTEGWSPEQVSGRLWLDFPGCPRMRVSTETIYRTLYTNEKFGRTLVPYLRRRRPRRQRRGERRPTRPVIPNRRSIELRPPQVDRLERYGDWEGDLVIGRNQEGAVVTLVERKSLFLCAQRVSSRHAEGVAKAIIQALRPMPPSWLQTITFDNGSEFAKHEAIEQATGTLIYFAHPYSAHERGRNEQTNGLLRQYLPKSLSFKHLSDEQLQPLVEELNNRPRKKLKYRTPFEVFSSNSVALTV